MAKVGRLTPPRKAGMLGLGSLRYTTEEWKLNVAIEDDLAEYYRSLIPKYYKVNRPKYPPHITVVRNEEIINKEAWKKYEGKEVEFQYSPIIQRGTVFWWLNAYCDFLLELREELGLPPYNDLTKPPDKKSCFHLTIGNMK